MERVLGWGAEPNYFVSFPCPSQSDWAAWHHENLPWLSETSKAIILARYWRQAGAKD